MSGKVGARSFEDRLFSRGDAEHAKTRRADDHLRKSTAGDRKDPQEHRFDHNELFELIRPLRRRAARAILL